MYLARILFSHFVYEFFCGFFSREHPAHKKIGPIFWASRLKGIFNFFNFCNAEFFPSASDITYGHTFKHTVYYVEIQLTVTGQFVNTFL